MALLQTKRFHLRWWHIPALLLAICVGLGIWALTWDWEPRVQPQLLPKAQLQVTNNAWIGYTVEPFEVQIKAGRAVLIRLRSDSPIYVKARDLTIIPLRVVFGDPRDLRKANLQSYSVQSSVTARKWGISKTIEVNEQVTFGELLAGTLEAIKDALHPLP